MVAHWKEGKGYGKCTVRKEGREEGENDFARQQEWDEKNRRIL